MTENTELVSRLNRLLEQEHACVIRYNTHAAVAAGPYVDALKARLKEIAGDEALHAEILRDRIVALGGTPSMQVEAEGLVSASSLQEIIAVNLAEEREALRECIAVFNLVSPSNAILYQALQSIIRDEQEHIEQLEDLRIHGQQTR